MKKKLQLTQDTLEKLLAEHDFKYSFSYGTNYEYETARHCAEEGCDGICRCETIEDFHFTDELPTDSIASSIIGELKRYRKLTDFEEFVITRVIYALNLSGGHFHADIRHSYYGEEIDSIKFSPVPKDLAKDIMSVLKAKTITGKTKVYLLREYGFILDSLQNTNMQIRNVPINSIRIPNDSYTKRLNQDRIQDYDGYKGIVALCLEDGVNYRLIDGYHRLHAAKKNHRGTKMVKIIAAKGIDNKTEDAIVATNMEK